jgi:hypothetical protein
MQRDWCLQVVQFVARGAFMTIDLAVFVLPIVKLTKPPCIKIHQGNVLQFIYYNKLIKVVSMVMMMMRRRRKRRMCCDTHDFSCGHCPFSWVQ